MITSKEVQSLLLGIMGTLVVICGLSAIGALCWWAWASESIANILTLAGLMGVGVVILVLMLTAWLRLTEEKP
jgi:hypothetical protein